VAQESYTRAFTDLGPVEQQLVRDDAEEQYVSYAFLRQSGMQHGNLNVDLQNDFGTRKTILVTVNSLGPRESPRRIQVYGFEQRQENSSSQLGCHSHA
jgi:hypothetical protein